MKFCAGSAILSTRQTGIFPRAQKRFPRVLPGRLPFHPFGVGHLFSPGIARAACPDAYPKCSPGRDPIRAVNRPCPCPRPCFYLHFNLFSCLFFRFSLYFFILCFDFLNMIPRRCDGIGRRDGLKIHCWRQRAGPSPATGTKDFAETCRKSYLRFTTGFCFHGFWHILSGEREMNIKL